MKQLIISFLLMFALISEARAATRSDVSVLEASESLQQIGQEIANNYLLYYLYPHKKSLMQQFSNNLDLLNQNIKKIAVNAKNPKTKGILSYFATKKTEIAQMLGQKPTQENVEEMVSVSELFSEGSKSISKHHFYLFSTEENMIMLTKKMSTDVSSTIKYYIAASAVPNDKSHIRKMIRSLDNLKSETVTLVSYPYKEHEQLDVLQEMNRSLKVLRTYLDKQPSIKAPMLILLLGKKIQKSLDALSVYHSQNQ